MSSIQKVRTYVYDTPATYDQFNGGINTNLSNEALEANEIRDGLNCHYINNSLVNRRGEKIIKKLILPINSKPQGDFLFSAENNDYIISVRNGHIYWGIFDNISTEITMTPLLIDYKQYTNDRDNCENYFIDIKEETSAHDETTETEGYVYKFISDGEAEGGTGATSEREYQRTLIIQNTRRVQGIPVKLNLNPNNDASNPNPNKEVTYFVMATGLRILRIEETQYIESIDTVWEADTDYYQYNNATYTYDKLTPGTSYIVGDTIPVNRKVYEYLGENSYRLYAHVMEAYKPNSWEYQNIGVNNFSPFPNYFIDESSNVPKTAIGTIVTEPKEVSAVIGSSETITATAKVNSLYGWEKQDFYYKWEARFGKSSPWRVVHFWDATQNANSESSKNKTSITLTGAQLQSLKGGALAVNDELYIRCTLTSDFQLSYDLQTKQYTKDKDEGSLYLGGGSATKKDFVADQSIAQYSKTHIVKKVKPRYQPNNTTTYETERKYWDDHANRYLSYAEVDAPIDNQFLRMHSCTKVVTDGTKVIFYDDNYNTCEWYKSVVGQANYLSYGGNLNFRTTKDERLIGVVVFDGNIVVFSDNDKLGGNISVVTGNGDDYNDGEYYSPYKRKIVNTNVSCDAYNTIQVAENYIIFKYRRDIYILDTNDLDGERVNVETINDKVKQQLNNVEFPLDRVREPFDYEVPDMINDFYEYAKCRKPDEIFSEVWDGYYGIIFPHQAHHMDTFEYPEDALKYYTGSNQEYIDRLSGRKLENISVKPGLRWKCYFRNGMQFQGDSKIYYPWLRDVSKYLNIVSQLTINGESTLVTENGELVQFNNEDYDGLDEYHYKVRVATKCYDMTLATLCKFMDNLNVYYNRDFTENFYCNMYVKNEAGYYIYTPSNEAYLNMIDLPTGEVKFNERYKIDDALNLKGSYLPLEQYDQEPYVDPMDKPVQILDVTPLDTAVLDRPNFTSVTLTPKHRFPFLSAQFILEMLSNQAFSLSSLTFSYTSHDMPDFTREKLYRDIIRSDIMGGKVNEKTD